MKTPLPPSLLRKDGQRGCLLEVSRVEIRHVY